MCLIAYDDNIAPICRTITEYAFPDQRHRLPKSDRGPGWQVRGLTHSLQAAAESLATPWSPPSHHLGCFETLFFIASLKINEAVYFQGNGPFFPPCESLLATSLTEC